MKKAIRIIGLVVVVVAIIGAIVASMNIKPSSAELAWDQNMTIGNPNAENHFIIYSDLACKYCLAFENALVENQAAFAQYLADNDVLLEIRLTDVLYHSEYQLETSRTGAVAAYCARDEGKFWDFYDLTVSRVWNDFIKDSGGEPDAAMGSLGPDYWIGLGTEVGLGDTFADCVENEATLAEVEENTVKAAKITGGGMPYFKFNKFGQSGGFGLTDGWDEVLMFFNIGLNSK